MHHVDLNGLRVAVLATDGFEQVELTSPVDALTEHGAEVEIVSLHPGRIRGMNHMYPGKKVRVDRTLRTADADDYDALLLPGGLVNPDTLRQSEQALDFVRAFERAGKPIAMICHAPWLLVSAGLVVRRTLTSWPGIRDDVRNAGGIWHDEPLVRDRNWVSSRSPLDLPQFNRGMLELFAERVPLAPARPEYAGSRPQPRRERGGAAVGKLVGGGLLAAAATYLIREQLRREGETLEYVEVIDLAPERADEITAVEYPEDELDLAPTAGGVAGGAAYRSGAAEYTGEYSGTDLRAGNGGTGPAGYGGTGYNPPAV
jgi:protease I